MKQLFFEDLILGETYVSPSITMTPTHAIMFGAITGDHHPLHNDVEYCKAHGWPERVVHGSLNASMTTIGSSPLAHQLHESVIVFLEQSTRFLKPVFLGDTVAASHRISDLIPKQGKGVLKVASTLRNQRNEVVAEGEQVFLVRKRLPE